MRLSSQARSTDNNQFPSQVATRARDASDSALLVVVAVAVVVVFTLAIAMWRGDVLYSYVTYVATAC